MLHIDCVHFPTGMEVVKLGGPVYRIGVGGGAASSIQVQGDNESELDFGAVQRGDAEMEQKLNRALRACVEMMSENPICSIHDQGAGGNGTVRPWHHDFLKTIIHNIHYINSILSQDVQCSPDLYKGHTFFKLRLFWVPKQKVPILSI